MYGPESWDYHPEQLARRFTAGNYGFAPLVMEDDRAIVDVNILLLRPGALGVIGQFGDMDNRLSTLFDALQVPPIGAKRGKGNDDPGPNETPFYCLVSNNKLISKVTVESDMLLDSIYRRDKGVLSRDSNDALVVITVEIKNAMSSSLILNRF